MALEALLPSEIARLIYGYLMEEKCIETAKTFLNESPNLQECRNVLSYGKHFTTRVCGYALWDILEKFCIINSIVQEKIDKCDNTDKLRHCSDLINQIKLLIEEYKGHKFLTNIVTTPTQNQSTVTNESFVKSHRRHSSSKDEDEVKHIEETTDKGFKTHTETNFSPIQNSYKTETTLLKNLPGYIKDLQTEQCETQKLKSTRKSREISKIDNILQSEELHENVILQEIKNKNHHLPDQRYESLNKNNISTNIEENSNKFVDSKLQSFKRCYSRLDKSTMTNRIEENLKNNKYSQIQAGNICSNDLQVSPTDECIELLSDLTLELLNRTEIQEIIADNINRILEPVKSNLHDKSNEDSKEELNKSFILEFNKAIEVAVNKTENDPEFLDLLNEIIPKSEEILNTDQIELNNRNVNKFKKVELVSKEKVTENSIDIKTISSQMFDQSTCYVLDIQNTNKIMNVQHADLSNTDKCVTESTEVKEVDLIKKNSKIPVSDARNSLLNPEKYIKSPYIDLNPIESSTVQQKSLYKSNNLFSYNNITSTPIKTSASIQNLDTYDWFSTQELLKPNILYQKDDTAMPSKTNTYTACETIVTTVASHISPIISKETTEVAERITTISYLSTNAIKEQTLHTPDTHSPKMKVSNSISSAFPINIVSKYKTPFSQKSSEVLDELLNLHSSQKSNGNIDNLSPLLKDNNEYNKYFSIESIMLYGMDNNLSTVKTPLIIPEIEVEDSITLTGTGLSPFLKIHKKSAETTDNLNEKNDEKVKYLGNRQSDEHKSLDEKNYLTKKPDESHIIVEKNSKELFTNLSQFIMKSTPKKILNKSKINRLSLSTPKKTSNYVRALNFNTPTNRSYSESKIKNKQISISPEIIKINLKNSCKSSLFQSPPFVNSDIIEQKQNSGIFPNIVLDTKNFIPINKEKYKIDETNEREKKHSNRISKDGSLKKNRIDKLINEDNKGIKKKVWDSDLRKCLGQYEINNINDSSKKNHKKKIKKETCKKITPKIKKKNAKSVKLKQLEKLEEKGFTSIDNTKKITVKRTAVESEISDGKDLQTAKELLDILSDNINNYEIFSEGNGITLASEEINNLIKIGNNKKICNNENIKKTIMKELSNKSVPDEESESKQIDETIKQSVSENNNLMDYEKIEEQLSIITNTNIKNNCSKKVEVIYDQVSKVERGKLVKKKYARLKTLDTNIAKSSFTMDKKRSPLSDFALELETLQKDEITLQVPPTPQILSPGSSSFMMPISKLSEDSRTIQSLVATPLDCPLTPKIVLTPPKSVNNLHKGSEKPISSPYYEPILNNFKISKKSEITQFEVIKENLLKNKKTIIESNIKNIDDDVIKLNTSIYREKKVNLKSDSSSASSCNCESCSSSNKEDIADIHKADDKDEIKKSKNIENNVDTSPMKVFDLICKPYEEINYYKKETPVKNDNTCTEVDIFETPSISKIIETPMNFNTKISDIMMFQEQEMQKAQNSKVKISKITTKSPMELIETFPSNIEMSALGIEKNANTLATTHTIQIKKSEEEVSKAVQSIITNQEEKINKNQNTSVDSIVFDSSFKNESKSIDNKLELVKALESITNTNQKTQDYSFFKSTNANNESDSEANLELVLEDENVSEISSIEVNKTKERFIQNNISPHQHNTRFKSRQMADEKNVSLNNSNGFSNSNIPCQEIQYVFDEDNYKRKRRKVFSNDELTWEFHDELGNLMNATAPTNLDIIFQINPARKRTLKQSKAIKREKFVYVEDVIKKSMMNHSNNNNPISDTNNATYNEKKINQINNKRKRTTESENIPVYRKRKKNIFIL